jgi:hypothetical protein
VNAVYPSQPSFLFFAFTFMFAFGYDFCFAFSRDGHKLAAGFKKDEKC